MKYLFARWASVCAALLLCSAGAHAADRQHHILWSLQGKTNKVYLPPSTPHMRMPKSW
jgi:hypothetical protein